MNSRFFALVLFFCLASTATAQIARFTANLRGDELDPPVQTTTFSGVAVFTYDRDSQELSFEIEHDVATATKAWLHNSEDDDEFEDLSDPEESPIEGSVDLDDDLEAALFAGNIHVIIADDEFPDGVIGGALTRAQTSFEAELKGSSQVPPAENSFFGVATFSYNHETQTLSYNIQHNVTNPTMAHIHGPADPDANGDVFLGFNNANSPMTGQIQGVTEEQEQEMLTGRYYVNIHNEDFPDGAVRGQVQALETSSNESDDDCEGDGCASSNDDSGLGTPAIVAIVIGSLAAVAAAVAAAVYFIRKRNSRNQFQRVPVVDEESAGGYAPPTIQ